MIFVANVLAMNGGTTFLIRTCRELAKRGERSAVLVLRRHFEPALLTELEVYAAVFWLDDFLLDKGKLFRSYFGMFGFVAWARLRSALRGFGEQVHAMGVFSLLFALRLAGRRKGSRVTVGIYHQNEFVFVAPPFYFARESQRLFARLPTSNVVFFNESTRNSHREYFCADYSGSVIVPIGIDFSRIEVARKLPDSNRIVSIGNLETFKTYNAHMIGVVAKLAGKYPDLRYEIYGTGDEEPALRALITRLKVEQHVRLLGALPYAKLVKTIEPATLFVGSGTALIEAAALGVPAIIGIESIPTPETYGLLSDVGGLSYNEDNLPMPKTPMLDLVDRLLADAEYQAAMGQACREKSRMFSVAATVDGLLSLDQTASADSPRLGNWQLVRLAVSLAAMAVAHRVGMSTSFAKRRNQSF